MISDSGSYSLPMALAVGFVGLVMLIYVFFMIHCSVESKRNENAKAVAWSEVRIENLIAKENELRLYQTSTNSKIDNLQNKVLELQGTVHNTTLTNSSLVEENTRLNAEIERMKTHHENDINSIKAKHESDIRILNEKLNKQQNGQNSLMISMFRGQKQQFQAFPFDGEHTDSEGSPVLDGLEGK